MAGTIPCEGLEETCAETIAGWGMTGHRLEDDMCQIRSLRYNHMFLQTENRSSTLSIDTKDDDIPEKNMGFGTCL